VATKFGDGIEQGAGEGLDAEIDGGEEAVCHKDDVSSVAGRKESKRASRVSLGRRYRAFLWHGWSCGGALRVLQSE
jgi:hypothetical protein